MDMISGFMQKFEESERLTRLEDNMKSARILGKKFCVKCGFCCHKRTCIPNPEEVKKIAEFLKLTTKELINKYFSVDWDSDFGYYVKPLGENIKDLGGKFIPDERTWNEGKCIFLTKENLCKIYSIRPKSAKLQECWRKVEVKEDTRISWKGNILKKEFKIDGEKMRY